MKTVDLIPIILYELSYGEKYGYEIIKNIEQKSNNQIEIKQPALYTVLKKLESNKFISSYWEDSEIGGKRHYYKITDNGQKQVDTLPAYDILLKKIFEDKSNEIKPTEKTVSSNNEKIDNSPIQKVEEVIDVDVAKDLDDSIDNKTNTQLNIDNLNVIKGVESGNTSSKFTQKQPKIVDYKTELEKIYSKANMQSAEIRLVSNEPKSNVEDAKPKKAEPVQVTMDKHLSIDEKINNFASKKQEELAAEQLKTVFEKVETYDYLDFKSDHNMKKAYSIAKQTLAKTIFFTLFLLGQVILYFILANSFGHTVMFDVCLALLCLGLIFYPTLFIYNFNNLKNKLLNDKYTYNVKKDALIRVAACILLWGIVVALNVTNITISGTNMFAWQNFGNFYAPILIIANILFEYFFNLITYKRYFLK